MARRAFDMLKRAYMLWREDDAPHVAAALTYYILLSTTPLLVVLVWALGTYLERTAVVDQIMAQANTFAGALGERVVRDLLEAAAPGAGGGTISLIAGLLALLGSTRVFGELRKLMNRMWDVPPDEPPKGNLWERARWWLSLQGRGRLRAVAMVVVVGVLLVASLAASAVVAYVAAAVPPVLPFSAAVARVLDWGVSVGLLWALFAVVFRYLPRTRIAWRDVAVGALATAVLFVLGRFALTVYFGYVSPGSAYGAAGSLVALLVWVNFSMQLVLLGAEFTYVWAHEKGSKRFEPARG